MATNKEPRICSDFDAISTKAIETGRVIAGLAKYLRKSDFTGAKNKRNDPGTNN